MVKIKAFVENDFSHIGEALASPKYQKVSKNDKLISETVFFFESHALLK